MHRRLAAVLTASVVGGDGSTESSIDSDRLRQVRGELIEPAVAAHEGRIVEDLSAQDPGVRMLAEFVNAGEALRCAIEIQRALRGPRGSVERAPHFQFRFAVNLGDVFAEGSTLRGAGVAICRRIEDLAAPGGICVTRTVLSQVKGRIDIAFEDLGEVDIEGFPEPVRVFEVLLDPDARRRKAAVPEAKAWYRQWPALALGLAVLAFLFSAGLWLFARGPAIGPLPPPPINAPPINAPPIDAPPTGSPPTDSPPGDRP